MSTVSAILGNYLWIHKAAVQADPTVFAPEWTYKIELLKTPEGRIAQDQIAFARAQAVADGLDPDEVVKNITAADHLTVNNWSDVGPWWALCAGDQAKVRSLVSRLGLVLKDKRVEVPWPTEVADRLKLLLPPRDYQPRPYKEWRRANHGIFKAEPAFGKTYIMIWSAIDKKVMTLVLVHTDPLAEQFITRFREGTPDKDNPGKYIQVTNCKQVERETGIQVIGRYESPEKLFPVTVATWQSFISDGGRRALKALGKSFGYVLCDEAHRFAAPAPASVMNGFHAKSKAGVTATPTRKDNLHVALYDIVGPVTAIGRAPQLPVVGYMIATGCVYPGSRFPSKAEWAWTLNWLVKQEARNDLIVDWLRIDVELGRKILVFNDRRQWCLDMAKKMKKEYGIEARSALGGAKTIKERKYRELIAKEMDEDKVEIIFATSTFKEGLDIPILDTLYASLPMNNEELLEQTLGRMRRPDPRKQYPIFRYFCDTGGSGRLYGCARGTQKHLINLDCEIVLVEEGQDPRRVMLGATAEKVAEKKPGLRGIGNRVAGSVGALFADLEKASREQRRYLERLGQGASTKSKRDDEEE